MLNRIRPEDRVNISDTLYLCSINLSRSGLAASGSRHIRERLLYSFVTDRFGYAVRVRER